MAQKSNKFSNVWGVGLYIAHTVAEKGFYSKLVRYKDRTKYKNKRTVSFLNILLW